MSVGAFHGSVGWRAALACVALLVASCAPEPPREVTQTLDARLGQRVRWNTGSDEDHEVHRALRALLERELTAESAVEIALLNNAGVQARFEELGIAQADVVQAGLMRNPVLAASWRFPDAGPRVMNAEYSVTAEFLDLLMIPLRQRIATEALERTRALVSHEVLRLAAEVKTAFYAAQAQESAVRHLATLVEIADAAETLAAAQHEAGNMSDLALARHRLAHAESKREYAAGRMELVSSREKVNRLLGLWGTDVTWRAAALAPPVPEEEWPLDRLESLALSQRLDYVAARGNVESLGMAAGITEDFRYLSTVRIGVDTEHETNGTNLTGPTLELEIPIFDNGDARIAGMRARDRQARQELIRLAVEIRSEAREARDQLIVRRELALLHGQSLVPLRTKILELSQLHANAMLLGPYELLGMRREEVLAQREADAALRDYWVARAALERAVGGRLGPAAAAPPTQSVPATAPAGHDHSSHGGTP